MMTPYWPNPWINAVPVPLDELARLCAGSDVLMADGTVLSYDRSRVMASFLRCGNRLDAYLLPGLDGLVSGGVRFGPDGDQYLSPLVRDQAGAKALLATTGPAPTGNPGSSS